MKLDLNPLSEQVIVVCLYRPVEGDDRRRGVVSNLRR